MSGIYSDDSDVRGGPLAGIRVIDLTTARSGPSCVRQLADMGAEVVQVARPEPADEKGSDAWNLHRNKRSIIVDLQCEAGREILLRLTAMADVLVENWRPAVKSRLRLDPDTLLAINPRLVYASLSGFGQDGPYAHRPGLDQIAQGMGGLMSVTGPPGTGPWRVGIAVSDLAAGAFLTQGILAALFARSRTGKGQWVHTSLLETMVNLMDFQAARWLNEGDLPKQVGNEHPTMPAMATFRTRDGYMNIGIRSAFDRFYAAIGAGQLASDPRFANNVGRVANRDALNAELQQVLSQRTTAEWMDLLAADFPCGPVLALDEVFADPQILELNLIRHVDHPTAGSVQVLRLPLTFSATPASIRSGPATPGMHTNQVLAELGYSAIEIDSLMRTSVVVDTSGVASEAT